MKKNLVSATVFFLILCAGPVFAANLTDTERLGKLVYESKLLSWNQTQSCATCHNNATGFADLNNATVSLGDDGVSTGGRNAPTSAYCGLSPVLHLDKAGEYVGGMFWDGRASGSRMHDPLAEQAQGPPLNPVEMNMPDVQTIIDRIARDSEISFLFTAVYGADAFTDVNNAFDNLARAVASYERSTEVSRFSSRFDAGSLNAQELRGKKLFSQNCTVCHSMARLGGGFPLFTSYKYVNAGVPKNPALEYDPNCAYRYPDLGLGGFIGDPAQNGKFKIPTLRNVALTAPYSHNGYFTTLKEMVSFMNNRSGFTPEVADNLSTAVGNLGLNDNQVEDVVAFLNSLTDM
ncbi:MAG: cytochrome c peroxidase [Desulfuromonadaceae bacterium]|nr:cytochrome c peroxidase [Desulfuromonadaceae bacterium]